MTTIHEQLHNFIQRKADFARREANKAWAQYGREQWHFQQGMIARTHADPGYAANADKVADEWEAAHGLIRPGATFNKAP